MTMMLYAEPTMMEFTQVQEASTTGAQDVTVSANSLDFGQIRPSSGTTQTFTVTNNGSQTLDLSAALDDPSGAFTVSSLPGSLAAGESVTVTVTVTSARAGFRRATLFLGDLGGVELSARITRWALGDQGATASLIDGEAFDHELRFGSDGVSLVNAHDAEDADLAPDSSWLLVAGGSLNDRLLLSGLVGGRTVRISGGGGVDTLLGPAQDLVWSVTGLGVGSVAGVAFDGFENLTGAADNQDTFDFAAAGDVVGVIDGGAGGFDSLKVNAAGRSVRAIAYDPHSGLLEIGGVRYAYVGLEPIEITAAPNLSLGATGGDDVMTLTPSATPGKLIFDADNAEVLEFDIPTGSLTIDGLGGIDLLTISGAINLGLIPFTAFAETIVLDGAQLTTSGAVSLQGLASDNGSTVLSGVDYLTTASPTAAVRLINGASLTGGSVTLNATASTVNTPPTEQLLILVINAGALVEVTGASQVNATAGGATLHSEVTVTASNPAIGAALFGSSTTNAAAAWAHLVTSSQVLVDAASAILATGAVLLEALTTNTVTSDGNAGAANNGAGIGVSVVDETTRARATGATLNGASVTVIATSTSSAAALATASANGATANQSGSQPNQASATPGNPAGNANTNDGSINVAAAIAFAYLASLTEAFLDGGTVSTGGVLGVRAHGTRSASTAANSGSVTSTGTGVGVAVAITLLNARTFARLLGVLGITAGSVQVLADNPTNDTVLASAISGQGLTAPGVAGALAVGITDVETEASLGATGAASLGGASLSLTAGSNLITTVTAAPQPGANPSTDGNLGIGASVALTVIAPSTSAGLANGAGLIGADDLDLTASALGAHPTTATGGAAGGTAVAAVVAITISNATTIARIGTGALLSLGGTLQLTASQSVSITTSATGDAVGANAAIGAALALTVANHLVQAEVARSITAGGLIDLSATGADSSTTSASASANGAPADGSGTPSPDAQAAGQRGFGDSAAAANGVGGSGTQQTPPAQGSGGPVAVAAAIAINLITTHALATIMPAVVVTAGGVTLATAANTDALTTADGTATIERGPPASIGVAVAITLADVTNSSTVAGTVNAPTTLKSLVNTAPDATHTFTATATSGAGGGDVSVAGSFALVIATLATTATVTGTVNGSVLDAEGASVAATTVEALPGEDTGSATNAGIGASIAIAIVNDTTTATVVGTVAGSPALSLSASQQHAVTTTARTGAAGGGINVAAAVALAITNLHVFALVDTGVGVSLASADVEANQTVSSDVIAAGDATNGVNAAVGVAIALAFADHSIVASTYDDLLIGGVASFDASSDSSVSTSATASATGAPEDDGSAPADGVDQQVAGERNNADSLAPAGGDSGAASTPSAGSSSGTISVAAAVAITVVSVSVDAGLDAGSASPPARSA
ncbi:MAG: hypothetical protein IPL43_07840 [Micropruina sp.]|nr:hypothetical protein [Micropruina sp.]